MSGHKNGAITIGVIIGIIIAAVIGADFLYFIPSEKLDQDSQAEKLQILGSQKQFKEIEEKLLANEKFQSLEKSGQWPIAVDAVKKGVKDNPFVENIKK
jgi:uncharacterized protein YpmB